MTCAHAALSLFDVLPDGLEYRESFVSEPEARAMAGLSKGL